MAETVGVIASIITCCHVVVEGIKYVEDLCAAPTEISALQGQIQLVRGTIQTLIARDIASTSSNLNNALIGVESVVVELDGFINSKLKRNRCQKQVSRMMWHQNKKKFQRLCRKLDDGRKAVMESMVAEILINTCQPTSTMPSFSQHTAIRAHKGQEDCSIDNDDQTIPVRRDSVHVETGLPILRRPLSAVCALQSAGSLTLEPRKTSLSTRVVRGWNPNLDQSQRMQYAADAGLQCETSPFGFLESSSSFHPAAYTLTDGVPVLFNYFNCEVRTEEYTRVNHCAMFYRYSSSRWLRITASITTTSESQYWDFMKATSNPKGTDGYRALPISLTSKLEDSLKSEMYRGSLTQDSHLSVLLGKQTGAEGSSTVPCLEMRLAKPPPSLDIRERLKSMTDDLSYRAYVPSFRESDFILRPLNNMKSSNAYFLAYLDSRWTFFCRFPSAGSQVSAHWYLFRVLYAVRGTPRISPLLGVVSDEASGSVTGFLSELPASGKLIYVLSQAEKLGCPISMERRLRWCRQIVQALAEIHAQGFVVGLLHPKLGIAIDGNDDAVLFNDFSATLEYRSGEELLLPPEYLRLHETKQSIEATYRTDVYHTGFLLWQIVENEVLVFPCLKAGCSVDASPACPKLHVNPRQLRKINQHVPDYLREIIATCRVEDPADRVPLWKLLLKFPSMEELDEAASISSQSTTKVLLELDDCYERYGQYTTCDGPRCGRVTAKHFFHCDTCMSADFDICPDCFGNGVHCLNDAHWLREHYVGMKKERYWSCVGEEGERQVVSI